MFLSSMIIWVLGLFTLVPYSIYYLLFEATRDQYAFLIVFPFFWILGYWGIVGPIISIVKVRRIMKALDNIESEEELRQLMNDPETKDVAIEFIATENKVPRFVARWIYSFYYSVIIGR